MRRIEAVGGSNFLSIRRDLLALGHVRIHRNPGRGTLQLGAQYAGGGAFRAR